MPAGGLFSTAADLARFCQMILNGGVSGGKRYLSETAVKEMTTRQTGPHIKQSYGLGWATGGGTYGHGGAYTTNMTIDPKSGLITIFLVQHAAFAGDGAKSLSPPSARRHSNASAAPATNDRPHEFAFINWPHLR